VDVYCSSSRVCPLCQHAITLPPCRRVRPPVPRALVRGPDAVFLNTNALSPFGGVNQSPKPSSQPFPSPLAAAAHSSRSRCERPLRFRCRQFPCRSSLVFDVTAVFLVVKPCFGCLVVRHSFPLICLQGRSLPSICLQGPKPVVAVVCRSFVFAPRGRILAFSLPAEAEVHHRLSVPCLLRPMSAVVILSCRCHWG